MTPTEAADVVIETIAPQWDRGTLVWDAVYEDATSYAVTYGNAEYLTGGDLGYLIFDLPLGFVDKTTHAITFGPYLLNAERIGAMTKAAPASES